MTIQIRPSDYPQFFDGTTRFEQLFWTHTQRTAAGLNRWLRLKSAHFDIHAAEFAVNCLAPGFEQVLAREENHPRESFSNDCGIDDMGHPPVASLFGMGGYWLLDRQARYGAALKPMLPNIHALLQSEAAFIGGPYGDEWWDPEFKRAQVGPNDAPTNRCLGRQQFNVNGEMKTALFLPLDLAIEACGALLAHAALAAQQAVGAPQFVALRREVRFFWSIMFYRAGYEEAKRRLTQHGVEHYRQSANEPDPYLVYKDAVKAMSALPFVLARLNRREARTRSHSAAASSGVTP